MITLSKGKIKNRANIVIACSKYVYAVPNYLRQVTFLDNKTSHVSKI
jgi:hypothetical protein